MNRNYIHEDDDMSDQTQFRGGRWVLAILALSALLIAGAFWGVAYAQTSPCDTVRWDEDCISWNAPLTRTDGSALPAADIGSYVLERAAVGSTTWTVLATITAPVQAYRYGGLKSGDAWQYRVSAVLKSGARSVPSEIKTATTTEPPPNPPVLKTVDATAYEIKPNSAGTLVATRVGLVPIGTACEATSQRVAAGIAYTRIPRDAVDMVNWPSTVKLQDVWGKCG